MKTATPAIRDFAKRLVALEAVLSEPPVAGMAESVRVCERLRLSLSNLLGIAGFHSVMSRAVAMAKAEVPSLLTMQVRADGSLEGLDGHGQNSGSGAAGVVIVAHLLGLLVSFIGEPLTVRLARDTRLRIQI